MDDIYWDPFDPKLRDDPYPLWKRLRDEAPLYYNDRHDFWVLSRFDDVEAAHKDHKTYSSAHNTTIEMMVDEPNNGKYYGGDVAAPVFSEVVQQTLRMMGVPPDLEVKPQILVRDVPAVEESF